MSQVPQYHLDPIDFYSDVKKEEGNEEINQNKQDKNIGNEGENRQDNNNIDKKRENLNKDDKPI